MKPAAPEIGASRPATAAPAVPRRRLSAVRGILADRDHRIVFLLWLLLVVEGAAFALLQPVWSRVDEAQHFHYVQYLVESRALPVEGETFISPEVVAISLEQDQWGWYPAGAVSPPVHRDPSQWTTVPAGLDQQQRERWVRRNLWYFNYEAMQPPLYYAVNAPLYAAVPGGSLAKLYAMRLLAVLMASLMVPIAYITAREAFPESRLVVLGTPVVVLLVQGYALNMSQVTNDALANPLAAAAVLAMLITARRGPSTRRSLVTGALVGAAMLAKATAIFLVPAVALALWLAARYRGTTPRQAWKQALVTALPAAALLGPWVTRNCLLYGDASGAAAATPLMSSFFASPLRDVSTLRLDELLPTFWFGEPIFPFPLWRYTWVAAFAAMAVAVLGLGYYFFYRFRYQVPVVRSGVVFLTLVFCGGLVVELLLPFASGIGGVPGRYLYPLLPAGAFLLVLGLDRLLRRERARFAAEALLLWMVAFETVNFLAYVKVR